MPVSPVLGVCRRLCFQGLQQYSDPADEEAQVDKTGVGPLPGPELRPDHGPAPAGGPGDHSQDGLGEVALGGRRRDTL